MSIVDPSTTARCFALVTFVNTAKRADNRNLLAEAGNVDNDSAVVLRRADVACDGVRYRAIETKCMLSLFCVFECFVAFAVVYPLIDIAYFPGTTTNIYRLARQVENVPFEEKYAALFDCSEGVSVERGIYTNLCAQFLHLQAVLSSCKLSPSHRRLSWRDDDRCCRRKTSSTDASPTHTLTMAYARAATSFSLSRPWRTCTGRRQAALYNVNAHEFAVATSYATGRRGRACVGYAQSCLRHFTSVVSLSIEISERASIKHSPTCLSSTSTISSTTQRTFLT